MGQISSETTYVKEKEETELTKQFNTHPCYQVSWNELTMSNNV